VSWLIRGSTPSRAFQAGETTHLQSRQLIAQALRGLIKTKPATDLALALPPWVFQYQRLSQDSNRGGRAFEQPLVVGYG
jgi:hypothetical protein